MKRCSNCRQLKPKEEFYRAKKNKDGLKCACKDCERVRKRKYLAKKRGAEYKELTSKEKFLRDRLNYIRMLARKYQKFDFNRDLDCDFDQIDEDENYSIYID